MEAGTAPPPGGASPPAGGQAAAQGTRTDEGGLPLTGIAAVASAVAIAVINSRMESEWGEGIFLVLNGLGAAGLIGLGVTALSAARSAGGVGPADESRPTGDVTATLVAGYFLLALAIGNLADILGAEGGSGSIVWTTLLFATIVAYPAWVLRSPVSALFDALASGIAFLAFIDWVFDYDSYQTLRWLLLILILAYVASSFVASRVSYRHGVQMINAAGLATLALAVLVVITAVLAEFSSILSPFGVEPDTGGAAGWELVLLIAAMGLVAYGALRREPGPAWLGGIALLLFVTSAALPGDDGPSLVGWPLVLILVALATMAAALALRDDTAGPGRA